MGARRRTTVEQKVDDADRHARQTVGIYKEEPTHLYDHASTIDIRGTTMVDTPLECRLYMVAYEVCGIERV